MRIVGGLLFIFGFLISLSVVGAFIGVPMMMLGIICIIFGGGRRKVVINNVVSVNSQPAALPEDMQPTFADAALNPHRQGPVLEHGTGVL